MRKTLPLATLLTLSILPYTGYSNSISFEQMSKDIDFLASDKMAGRGNFSPELKLAAQYIAKRFKEIGLKPLANQNFLQEYQVNHIVPANIKVTLNNQIISHDKIAIAMNSASLKWQNSNDVQVIYIDEQQNLPEEVMKLNQKGGQYLVMVSPKHQAIFQRFQAYLARGNTKLALSDKNSMVMVLTELKQSNLTKIAIESKANIKTIQLQNVVGVLPALKDTQEQVIFSAHYDHLGNHIQKQGDTIYNGADDDASGTTAVINLAQYFKNKKMNQRDLIFVAFSAEEIGGFGSKYFSTHIEPKNVTAMFNIEMIGKPSKFGSGTVWMTGTDRSSLFSDLNQALKNTGHQIYQDPYPEQNLFYRSDNATLARLGVPAHSFSSTQLDKDKFYHQPTDEISTIDKKSMYQLIKTIAKASEPIANGKITPSRINISEVNKQGVIF